MVGERGGDRGVSQAPGQSERGKGAQRGISVAGKMFHLHLEQNNDVSFRSLPHVIVCACMCTFFYFQGVDAVKGKNLIC